MQTAPSRCTETSVLDSAANHQGREVPTIKAEGVRHIVWIPERGSGVSEVAEDYDNKDVTFYLILILLFGTESTNHLNYVYYWHVH